MIEKIIVKVKIDKKIKFNLYKPDLFLKKRSLSCPEIGLHQKSVKMGRKKESKADVIQGKEFTWKEREMIVKEYLGSGQTKRAIWEKYTGQKKEDGQLLSWMRQLGYDQLDPRSNKKRKVVSVPDISEDSFEELKLKKRILELEQELKESQMRAISYWTMIDIAEKEFKISIRKKYNTKPSKK